NLATALAIGSGAAAVVGLMQAFGLTTDAHGPHIMTDGIHGAFDHERTAALSLACVVPLLAVAVGLPSPSIAKRVVIGVGLALTALYIGLTDVPLAYLVAGLGVVVGVVVVAAFKKPKGLTSLTQPLVACAIVAALMGGGEALSQMDRVENLADRLERASRLRGIDLERQNLAVTAADWGRAVPPLSMEAQRFAWSTAVGMLTANVAVGVGEGNYDLKSMAYLDQAQPWYHSNFDPYPMFRSAHNSYLHVAGELGIVGLLCVLLTVALCLWGVARALGAGVEREELLPAEGYAALVGALAALLIASVVDNTLHQATTGLLFAVVLGALARDVALRLGEQGPGHTWRLSGAGMAERVAAAGLVPLLLIGVMGYGATIGALSDFYKARGDVWLRAGGLKQAEQAYQQALTIAPRHDLALLNVANIHGVLEPRESSEQSLLKALEVRPFDSRLHTAIGIVQTRMALQTGREQVKKKAADPKTYREPSLEKLQELFAEYDVATMKRAENNLKTALELHPHNLRAYKELTNVYLARKNTEKARITILENIDEIQAHDKAGASALYLKLAQVYMQDEKWRMSKKHFETALELDPGSPQRRFVLGELERVQAKIDGRPMPNQHNHGHGHGHGHGGGGFPGTGSPAYKKGLPPGEKPHGDKPPGEKPHGDKHDDHDEPGDGHHKEAHGGKHDDHDEHDSPAKGHKDGSENTPKDNTP
ncbi:MAG: O-antigen ligase family protein, partial [Myxococcota bacterium]